jgi:phage terminase large subunit
MLRDSTIRTFLEVCPQDIIEFYNRSEQHLKFINGTEILFRPGNDIAAIDRLRNINVGWFWMDEASMFLEYAWKVLIGRLREQTGPRRGWVTTTPKGYNWTWRKFVDHATSDYFYTTASSLDNPYLPEDYKRTLQQEYTGVFASQEIYGQFVGFEGCVYPEFNRVTHVIDTSQYKFEAILAGVDFGFTNPSVILKIGIDYDGRLYILDEFYERHVTDSTLAEYAKDNFKDVEFFIADSENPSAIQEFKNRDLECKGVKKQVAEPRENFIISGIKRISNLLVVRGDGRPRLYVDQKCVNTIMEFENYRYPEGEEEKPEKEAPLKVFDHCLIGDTLVETIKGSKKIKDIKLGEIVLTRKGYRKVLKSGVTIQNAKLCEVRMSNGKLLIGTPDHKIWVNDKGFIPMDSLRYKYKLNSINENVWIEKKSPLTESYSEDMTKANILSRRQSTSSKDFTAFISMYGKRILERFLLGLNCITKMATKLITALKISNALKSESINQYMEEYAAPERENILTALEFLQKNGTHQKQVSDGTEGMELIVGKKESLSRKNVITAATGSMTSQEETMHDSALTTARAATDDGVFVLSVRQLERREDVYDITVEGCHEFYANDVLVHNSMDALRYVVTTLGEEFDKIIFLEEQTKKEEII